ncbi:MAG TPA: TIGR03435 family protein, partial [Terriglobia bacterium]|nr:TIGR03435 family protein [Terriglobia bacterium]
LAIHRETRETQGYLLIPAKDGTKLKNAPKDEAASAMQTRSSASYRNFGVGQLVLFLSTIVGRPVIDGTGLTGRYDIELKWTPSELEAPRSDSTDSQSGPSLFTALQEQLGLRLESSKVPAEYLIVDHAEMPTSN